jgi:hypothetical protein
MRFKVLALGLMLFGCGSRTPFEESFDFGAGGILPDGGRSGAAGSPGTGGQVAGSGGSVVGSGGGYGTGGSYGTGASSGTGGSVGMGGSFGTGGSVGMGGNFGTGGFQTGGSVGSGGGVGGSAGYPIAKPGLGLIDILPGIDPTPLCEKCVQTRCPEAVACSNDPACANGLSCVVGECPLRGRRGPALECLVMCFGGNVTPAIGGLAGVNCIYNRCDGPCGVTGGGRMGGAQGGGG